MMKDFNAWLADTTEYLRDEPVKPKAGDYWITPDGWGVLGAYPEPCALCGSAEEVCKCEELPLCGICECPEDVCECDEVAPGFAFFCRPEPSQGMRGSITSPAEEMKGAHSHSIKAGYNLNDYTKQFLHAMNQRRRPPRRMNDDEDE